jgi:putative transposon-encoded protein
MTRIRISEKHKEIEGKMFAGVVKPSGNSAHIPFSKEHVGKHVNVIVPSENVFCWIFSDAEKRKFVTEGRKAIEKHVGKMKPHWLDGLQRVENNLFSVSDILAVCDALENQITNKCRDITAKIRKTYILR